MALGKRDDGSGEEQVFLNPYPLENKYKDEADRAHLAGLAEIERESILFDRSQEIEKFNQSQYLALRAKVRQEKDRNNMETSKATRVSTRDKSGSSTKHNKLSELKKKREEKKSRESGRPSVPYRDGAESEEEASASETEDAYGPESDEQGKVEWAEPQKAKELTAHDLNKIRFGRTLFSKFCHNPGFESAAIGTFVRINIGFDSEKQIPVYRICEIKALQKTRPYKFLGRTSDESIVVATGRNERTFEMGICSDSSFTEDEFRWWKQSLLNDEITLPSVKRIDRKLQELIRFKAHVLTPDEVNELIQRRQKLSNSTGVGVVLEKTTLQQQRVIALENGDEAMAEEIEHKIAAIESKLDRTNVTQSPLDKLAHINIRNRRANQTGVRKAELKANEQRRKTNNSSVTENPFSRLRTTARVFYQSDTSGKNEAARKAEEEALAKKKVEEENERRAKEKAAAALRKSSAMSSNEVDDMIAGLDIRLEIEI